MTRGNAAPGTVERGTPAFELRALRSPEDCVACVDMQRDTWGADYADTVPASLLKVSQMVGGVTGGAFTPDGRLVGFVYGLTGIRGGRVIHWSHMLAVRPEYRDHGVGRRLKEYQRSVVRELGVEIMFWTFDPLVARNAHLNLNRLGAVVCEYIPDMYGDTGSALHAFGTDRFVVSWAVDAAMPAPARTQVPAAWRLARPASVAAGPAGTQRIEVPADVAALPVAEAKAWRARTRPAFVRLLADGYEVSGFFGDEQGRSYYVLTRPNAVGKPKQPSADARSPELSR